MDRECNVDLAIWINGNEKLRSELNRRTKMLDEEISNLQKEASRFHKKKIGCREYWYMSGGKSGVWRYVCEGGKNPIKEIEKRIDKTRRSKENVVESVNKAIIKPLGKHLLVDLDRFEPSDGEVISSLELYEALRELSR
jgi:hypothetical protein